MSKPSSPAGAKPAKKSAPLSVEVSETDALATASATASPPLQLRPPNLLRTGPFRFGFITTVGVLLALLLGLALSSLGQALTLIFFAGFVSLGLHPVVKKLEQRMPRVAAILVVIFGFLLLVALLVWLIAPVIATQSVELVKQLPGGLSNIQNQDWFIDLNQSLGGALTPVIAQVQQYVADPAVWLAVSGGALRVGAGILNGIFGLFFVVALTLYFVASLDVMKKSLYELVPASRRPSFVEIAEEIADSVGKYLSGMFILAVMNAAYTFVLLSILGVRFAGILAALALPITFIPLVGSLISTAIITVVSLFTSPLTALLALIFMMIYLQIEAYVLTPKIVGKAIDIPGSLVLIGAMIGGTLLGLLGALVACPVSAATLLIIKKVIVPAQAAR